MDPSQILVAKTRHTCFILAALFSEITSLGYFFESLKDFNSPEVY